MDPYKSRLGQMALWFSLMVLSLLAACGGGETGRAPTEPSGDGEVAPASTEVPVEPTAAAQTEGERMTFDLSSEAFAQGEEIPQEFSCDGDDTSPPLRWSDPPDGTASLALVMDDPDAPAGTWDHWVLYNLPPGKGGLEGDIAPELERPDGSLHGQNSWGSAGYGGPCPPSGTHRYFFRLYALDTSLQLPPGASKAELMSAMEGHVLAEAELMGTYTR